jgi:hypothetical protein
MNVQKRFLKYVAYGVSNDRITTHNEVQMVRRQPAVTPSKAGRPLEPYSSE